MQVWTEDGTGGGFTDCGYWVEAFSPGVEKAFSSPSARFVCEKGLKHTLKPLNSKNVFKPGVQCLKYEVVVWPADCVVWGCRLVVSAGLGEAPVGGQAFEWHN